MSDSPGKFSNGSAKATGAHQKAEEKDKDNYPLPDSLVYEVPPEVAKTLREPPADSADPHGTSTHSLKEVATLIYMDVGRWSGSAPTKHDTQSHWGRRRDFGIVYGRLAALCTYTRDPPQDEKDEAVLDAVGKSIQSSTEFKKILPLLKVLSSNPELGWVQVTKAVLGRKLNNEIPKDDRIYVILGDLHAPVMTDPKRTYSDEAQQKSLADTAMAVQSIPGGYASAALASGVLKRGPFYEWRGRYDRGFLARNVLPVHARVVGESGKVIVKANPIAIYAGEVLAGMEVPLVAVPLIAVGGVTSMVMIEIAAQTRLREWPDRDGGDADSVRDWFERYHGTRTKKGADIFEEAGANLLLWLKLLKDYQAKEGGKLPVRLMQLGDLFDFWIGLKCPFSIIHGAKSFPKSDAAWGLVKYWMDQALEAPAINYLWNFDKYTPATRPDLKTVFLYGNHDTYMGSLPPVTERLKERFEDDPGLVAQHGHQEDTFNKERNAAIGYLLTQAAFSDDYVRTIEDPMSALGPTLFGGNWTRLDLAEMALRTCIFDRVKVGKQPALTFVMGHTHEPVLQVIHVVAPPEDKSRATGTSTGTSTGASTGTGVGTGTSAGTGSSTATGTSTGQSRNTSTKTR